jgi:DNA-directed RNA polymerase subunit beta'
VLLALTSGEVETQSPIRCATRPYINLETQYDNQDSLHAELEELDNAADRHHGRPRHPQHAPADEIPFINGLLKKRGLQDSSATASSSSATS